MILSIIAALATTVGAFAADVPLKVTAVKGNVVCERAGKPVALTTASALKTGDAIKTSADSEATIAWGDGNIVKVYPLSKFTLDEASKSGDIEKNSLNLETGKIFAKAKKLTNADSIFQVKTPTARAGVRGSEIFVTASDTMSNFAVLSGVFQIEADGLDVTLNSNYQIDVGAAPEQIETAQPVPISSEQMEEMKIEAESVVGGIEETVAPAEPAEPSPVQDTVEDTAGDTVQDTLDESVTNDTITNPALDTTINDLMEGMGGVNITVE